MRVVKKPPGGPFLGKGVLSLFRTIKLEVKFQLERETHWQTGPLFQDLKLRANCLALVD